MSLGGLGRLTRGEEEPLILTGSVGEEGVELEETDRGGMFRSNRGGVGSSVGGSGFVVSGGRMTLLGGGVGLPASLAACGT